MPVNKKHIYATLGVYKHETGNTYRYDQLNRITKSRFWDYDPATITWSRVVGTSPYDETFRYDKNGNIDTLQRYAYVGGPVLMDNLSYTYNTDWMGNRLNQLNSVSDAAGSVGAGDVTSTSYAFNPIGELQNEVSAGENRQLQIMWTPYGKVDTIMNYNAAGTTLMNMHAYLYDAMGNQVRDLEITGTSVDTTYLLYDGHNTQLAKYHMETPPPGALNRMEVKDMYLYSSEKLGKVVGSNIAGLGYWGGISWFWTTNPQRYYELHDHLGNVRATICNKPPSTGGTPMADYYDYYAFGSYEPNRFDETIAGPYPFGFNGKERKDDWRGLGNSYDYGFRTFDARIGRFTRIDPLFYSYPYNSPYAYAENSPIVGVDKDGLELLPVMNSSMYQMKSTTIGLPAAYEIKYMIKNIPANMLDNKGEHVKYSQCLGGVDGEDMTGPSIGSKSIPEWADGGDIEQTPSSKGEVSGPNSLHRADNAGALIDAAGVVKDMYSNWSNQSIWENSGAMVTNKINGFYSATKDVNKQTANLPSQFQNGAGKADLINLLTDGTIPNINVNDSREAIKNQSRYVLSLIETGMSVAQKQGIPIRDGLIKLYENVSTINLSVGGNGGEMYQTINTLYNNVKAFIQNEIGHWSISDGGLDRNGGEVIINKN